MTNTTSVGIRQIVASRRPPWTFIVLTLAAVALSLLWWIQPVDAAVTSQVTPPTPPTPSAPAPTPTPGTGGGDTVASEDGSGFRIDISAPDLSGDGEGSGNAVIALLGLSVISIAPSLLVLMTSFTRITVVLSMARNALGLPAVPPNQVLVGLSLFLTLFVMGPVLSRINDTALQPLLREEVSTMQALKRAEVPIREFMFTHTRDGELKLMLDAAGVATPVAREDVPLNALIPAFVLSELRTAFTIGFVIFLPFLVIDLVVSSVLMSLGLMMLPPTFVSLPFKILLFVLMDGWTMVVGTLLTSYGGGP